MRLIEAWKKIREEEINPPIVQDQIVNIQLTKKEIILIKSLIQTALSEMTSDPNSGMKGIPQDIVELIKKLDSV